MRKKRRWFEVTVVSYDDGAKWSLTRSETGKDLVDASARAIDIAKVSMPGSFVRIDSIKEI